MSRTPAPVSLNRSSRPTWLVHQPWFLGWALFLAVMAVYYRVGFAGFVWDDNLHISDNPTIVGPLGLKEIWTTSAANYFPLVLTNLWLQHAAWGLDPLGYHIVTLAFHALSAVVLWRVLLQLEVPGAWLGAALWALHPVQVESAAWVCELKNTQSSLFFLWAVLGFTRWLKLRPALNLAAEPDSNATRNAYVLTLVCAVLALMSKPSTVMLPPVLALILWWKTERIDWRAALALAPFFLLSALVAGWTIWEQKVHSGAVGDVWNQTPLERLAIAGRAFWFYAEKLVWPHPLIFIYPRWTIATTSLLTWLPVLSLVAVSFFLLWKRTTTWKPVFLTTAYFGIMLFPILGFFTVYFFRYSFVGDHFQYLASIGPLALAGAAVVTLAQHPTAALRRLGRVASIALPAVLAVMTWKHTQTFQSSEGLWRATLSQNPTCVMAWINLAGDHAKAARYDEAIATFQTALTFVPNDVDVHNDMAGCYLLSGRPAEAVSHFEHALRFRPEHPEAHNGLGNALHAVGRREESVEQYREAIRLKPDYAEPLNNLGTNAAEIGRPDEAVGYFEQALRLSPRDKLVRTNLARALHDLGESSAARGEWNQALAAFRRVVELDPHAGSAHTNLATTLVLAGRVPEAIEELKEAIRLDPANAVAQRQLAVTLVNVDRLEDAVPYFEGALRIDSNSAETHAQLAQVLGVLGRGPEAESHARESARLRAASSRVVSP